MVRKAIAPAALAALLAGCAGNFNYYLPFPTKPAKRIALSQTQVADLQRQVVLSIGHTQPVIFGNYVAGRHRSRPSEILVCLWADPGNVHGIHTGSKLYFAVLDQNNTLTTLAADGRRQSASFKCRDHWLRPRR